MASGALAGLRIVEFEGLGPVPLCAMLLADHGADVVRIARPGRDEGDPTMGAPVLLRSRSGVTLDLKNEGDRARALELVARADAVLEGYRPGVMERLGLGPDVCLARNSRLVFARMTGWGQTGPLAAQVGHDINYIGLTGALAAMGPADRPPPPPLNIVGDYAGGAMMLAFGVLAAVRAAERSGRGQAVDVAMTDGVAALLGLFHAALASGHWENRRDANLLDGGAPFYRCYACADGGFVAVGAIEAPFYRALMEALDLSPSEHPQSDRGRWPATAQAIAARFAVRPRDAWAEHFAGRDACVTPVLDWREARKHPHATARGAYAPVGGVVQAAPAPRFERTPGEARPATREDADAVLARWS